MDKHVKKIREILTKSADFMEQNGHHQHEMWKDEASCIMGAPRLVEEESSYSHLIRHVLNHLGYGETWNDEEGRTKDEVVDALRNVGGKVTPEVLEELYGPSWQEIFDFIVEVDSWDQDTYDRISQGSKAVNVYEMNRHYLPALAAFMATVMTNGKTTDSRPFKNYFDEKYRKWL